MTVLDQITRPFNWLRVLAPHSSSPASKATVGTTGAMVYQSPVAAQQVQLDGNRIKLPRKLDAGSYQEVLSAVQQVQQSSVQDLVLDLGDVEHLELAGIFALHCVGFMVRGETIPDATLGWRAMRAAAERNLAAGRQENVTLLNPSSRIEALLRANHFDRILSIDSQSDPDRRLL